jgi:hypothetical protein
MRIWTACLIASLLLGLGACTRQDAKQAGRTAYKVTQETKKAAKKAGQELQQAGREARKGWKEQKRKDAAAGKKE